MRPQVRTIHDAGVRAVGTPWAVAAACVALFVAAPAAPAEPPAAPGILDLQIVDAATGEPVPYPNLLLIEARRGFLGSAVGAFHLELPPGTARFRVMHISYEPSPEIAVELESDGRRTERIALTPQALVLPTVEVSGASQSSPRVFASGVRTVTPEMLEAMPNLRDDPFQMLRILPGVAADDVGSEFTMRGGGIHETLVRIDGMEVRQLFHGRDFGGITGIVPLGLVDKMDVYLGGFPAQYGGRLSGVVDLDLKGTAPSGAHVLAGVDAVSARVLAQTTGEKSSTFLSVREGYLDRVLDLVQDDAVIQPAYRDLLLRGVRRPSPEQSISLNYLRSEDHLYFEDGYERHFVNADYLDHYVWSTWKHAASNRLSTSATAFGALSNQLRQVGLDGRDDHRTVRGGARLDFGVRASEAHLVKLGAQVERETGTSFVRTEEVVSIGSDGTVETISGFEGEEEIGRVRASAFLQDDWRPVDALSIGVGVRASHDTDTAELRWNPRASLAWQLGAGWTLRGAWGEYDQAPDVQVSDEPGLRLTSDRAAWAEHVVAGLEKRIGKTTLGLDAYAKDFHRLDGVVARTTKGEVTQEIVTRGGSNGIEAYIQHASPGASWWLTYTVAKSTWGNEERTFLRDFDQRHALSFANTFRLARDWDVGATYSFHSGRPYTLQRWTRNAQRGSWTLNEGQPNGARLPQYHRVDLRLRRHFRFDGWRMSVYAEGLNLTNHDNVLWYSWGFEPDEAGVRPVKSARTGMPALPTLGVEVEF